MLVITLGSLLQGCDVQSTVLDKVSDFEIFTLDKSSYDCIWADYNVIEVYENSDNSENNN